MKRKLAWIAAVGVAALLIGTVSTQAAGRGMMARGPEGAGFHMERFGAGLGLTDEQKEKLDAIHEKGRDEMLPLQKEMARARNEMKGEWLKDSPSESALRKLAEKIGGIETQMEILRIQHHLAMRNILTAEQRDRMFVMGDRMGGRGFERGDRDGRRCGDSCMHGRGMRGGRGHFGECDGTGPGQGKGMGPGAGRWQQPDAENDDD